MHVVKYFTFPINMWKFTSWPLQCCHCPHSKMASQQWKP